MAAKDIDYKILYSQTLADLQEQVKTHLHDGYSLAGGVSVDGTGQPSLYNCYQAVYKNTLIS